jgi:hypothetical protein
MRSMKDLPRRHQTRVPHPEQSKERDTTNTDPDPKRDTVGEFPTSLCKFPQCRAVSTCRCNTI